MHLYTLFGELRQCHCPIKSYKHEISIISGVFDIYNGTDYWLIIKLLLAYNIQVSSHEMLFTGLVKINNLGVCDQKLQFSL